MKILNVRIKNINSLAGEHEIEFDKPPLNEVGIFAITGPNGSGKTTILDAICLALYGQTPRFRAQSEEVMNKRSAECEAEVTFTLDHHRYRSLWSARRAGGAVHTRMQLVEIDGGETVLKETVNSVREEIGRLTGLDFKRFSRSVLLPQGEFAAFLHALSSERVDVIDKIVGKEAYEEHCAAILKAARAENDHRIAHEEALAGMPAPERDALLQEAIETTEKAYLATSADLDALKNERDLIRRRDRDKQAYQEGQIALSAALARKEAMRDEIRRLERAKAADAFDADLMEYETQAAVMADREARLAALKASIEAHEHELAELSERETACREALARAEAEQAADAGDFEAAVAADREINAEAEAFRSKVDRYEAIEREQQENLQAQATVKDDIARNASERAAEEKWLEQHRAFENLKAALPGIQENAARLKSVRETIASQDARRRESLQRVESARAFLDKARSAHAKSLGKVETLQTRRAGQEETAAAILADISAEDFESGVQQNIRRLKACKQLLKAAKGYRKQVAGNGGSLDETLRLKEEDLVRLDESFEAKQTAMVHFERKIKFDEERSLLKSGAPCPLCGSLDHPYSAEPTDAKNARKILKGMKKELKALLKARNQIIDRIKDLQKRLARIEEYRAAWETLCQDAGGAWPIGDVDAVRQALREIRQEVRSGKKALRIVRRHEGKSRRMAHAVESAAEKLQERQAVLSEKEGEVTLHRKLLAAIEQEAAETAGQEAAFASALMQAVDPFGEKVPGPGAEDDFLLKITVRAETFRTRREGLIRLAQEGDRLVDRAARLPEELKALKSESEALEGPIEASQKRLGNLRAAREARFGTEDPIRRQQAAADRIAALAAEQERIRSGTEASASALSEDRKALAEAAEAFGRAKTAHDTLDRLLKNKVIAVSVFRSVDDVRESFITAEEKAILEAHVRRVEEEIAASRNTLEKLKISSGAPGTARSAAEVELAIEDAEKQAGLLRDDLDRLTERDAAAQRARTMYREAETLLEELRKRCDRLNAMKTALESGDDARIRRGFHEEMFRKLLEKTGGYVGMLNDGRYRICQSEKDPFGLEVETASDGEPARRPVEGLSGGETFLISLSMALALSDLTEGGRKIQSLFIDEGFGYLDDENLTQVINTLNDHLKANGKRVGVISHVSRLDREFQTKIQVIPGIGGTTRLEVLPKERPPHAG
ncbi:AAA family ATPase [Desulfococcus sp.]|uniref:AAA family ATPase n=1 Tax=Desulfococcus sp. TaxID=2025834 RepID=UPI0035948EAA